MPAPHRQRVRRAGALPGAIVYYTFVEQPDLVALPVGVFADPTFPTPTVSVYEERMHPWVTLPGGIDHMH